MLSLISLPLGMGGVVIFLVYLFNEGTKNGLYLKVVYKFCDSEIYLS